MVGVRERLVEHERRRSAGLPTLTVLAGPPALGARAWSSWSAVSERRVAQGAAADPLGAWLAAAAEELALGLGDRTAHERDLFLGAELAAFCRAPQAIDRGARDRTARVLAARLEARAPTLLVCPAPDADPRAFLGAAARELSAALEALPSLSAAIAAPVSEDDVRAVPGRAGVLVDEGLVRVALAAGAVADRLAAAGVDLERLPGCAERLAAGGVDEETLALFAEAATSTGDLARSAAERFLFDRLEASAVTAGLFARNVRVSCGFTHGYAEVDLLCERFAVAVEIDGYHHFRDPEAYRRDRRKDLALQGGGYLVARFLAEDVVARLEDVLETLASILRLAHRGDRP